MSYKTLISRCKRLGLTFKVSNDPAFKYEIVDKKNSLRWACKSLEECAEAVFQSITISKAKNCCS